jgi:hypothetical protein
MMSASESTPTLLSWLVFNPSRDMQPGRVRRMRRDDRGSIAARLRELAPYAAILLIPGGSLMALLLWVYRRKKNPSLVATYIVRDEPRFQNIDLGTSRR